jgi:hypothetical protein
MTRQLLLTAAAVVVMLMTGNRAEAQVITVNANYDATPPNQPSTRPSGTYSVPAPNPDAWQVVIDYGTIPNGTFVPWAQGPMPNAVPLLPGPNGGGPFLWGQPAATLIINPPAGLHVRARLQRRPPGGVWAFAGNPAINSVP